MEGLGSPGCSTEHVEKEVSDPVLSVIFLDLTPTLFMISAASGPRLSPVHPLSQIPLSLPLGKPRCCSLYAVEASALVAGGVGVMLPSALRFLFWRKGALRNSWLACQLGSSAPV